MWWGLGDVRCRPCPLASVHSGPPSPAAGLWIGGQKRYPPLRLGNKYVTVQGLLKEGVECLLAGDVETGEIVLRDYINASMGFEELASITDKVNAVR